MIRHFLYLALDTYFQIRQDSQRGNPTVSLSWDREGLFDKEVVQLFLTRVQDCRVAHVVNVAHKARSKAPPIALNTVELLRAASSKLHIGPKLAMDYAERLYTEVLREKEEREGGRERGRKGGSKRGRKRGREGRREKLFTVTAHRATSATLELKLLGIQRTLTFAPHSQTCPVTLSLVNMPQLLSVVESNHPGRREDTWM